MIRRRNTVILGTEYGVMIVSNISVFITLKILGFPRIDAVPFTMLHHEAQIFDTGLLIYIAKNWLICPWSIVLHRLLYGLRFDIICSRRCHLTNSLSEYVLQS